MASDSQSTESSSGVRRGTQKVHPLGTQSVWGGSGYVPIIEDVGRLLDGLSSKIDATDDFRPLLRAKVPPLLQGHYNAFVQVPGTPIATPASTALIAGYHPNGNPYILEIDPNAVLSTYEDIGFHAIGSGAAFAQMANALLAHMRLPQRPLQYGLLVAYRVINAVIETSASGVGPPVQMWQVTPSGGVSEIGDDELKEINTQVGLWQEFELETLDQFLTGGDDDDDVPLPAAAEGAVSEESAEDDDSDDPSGEGVDGGEEPSP